MAHEDISGCGAGGTRHPSTKGHSSSVQGDRSRQGLALPGLSWLCLVLTAPMSRASPDQLLSLADVTVTLLPAWEGRAGAESPGWSHDTATSPGHPCSAQPAPLAGGSLSG